MFLCEWSSSRGTSNPWIFGAAQTSNTSWCDKCNEGDKEESIHCWLCKWAWRRGSGGAYFGPCCVILGTACVKLQRKETTKGGIGACSSEVVGRWAWTTWSYQVRIWPEIIPVSERAEAKVDELEINIARFSWNLSWKTDSDILCVLLWRIGT